MRLGLGLSLSSGNVVPSAAFDMADVSWRGWWDGDNYDAGTGTASGKASAGASGSRSLTEATNKPTAGATLNGHASMSFASNKKLTSGVGLSSLIAADAWTAYVVFKANAVGGAAGLNGEYALPAILSDNVSHWALGVMCSGPTVHEYQYAMGSQLSASIATGTPYLLEAHYDGTDLFHRIGAAGTEDSVANGNVSGAAMAASAMLVGCNYGEGAFFNGLIWEIAITNTNLDATTRSNVRSALSTKYGGL